MSKIKKVISKIEEALVKLLSYFNVRAYMKHYVKHLQKLGIQIPDYDGRSFISADAQFDGTGYKLITVGQVVTISTEVRMLVHDYSISRGIKAATGTLDPNKRYRFMKPITIKDGAFIGARCILLPGTIIGENSIIGAGSVVHGTIPDNVVAAGNPAKVISSLEAWGVHLERQDFEEYTR